MKHLIFGILTIFIVKGLVYFNILHESDLNRPFKIDLNITGLNLDVFNEEKIYFEIIDGKTRVGDKFFNDYDLVDVNGKTYVVDTGLEKAQLHEYTVAKRIERNFHLLNSQKLFSWFSYLVILAIIVYVLFAVIPNEGILLGVFLIFIFVLAYLIPIFFVIGYLGWSGWVGLLILILYILIDILVLSFLVGE
ncbi:hypothetical protein [Algoriphagus yeomjeoni]|uniref:Uncharacterized protein n=1 Tax=Algoriphagus yeomjeoni TaxID=291403 RepID=A0A327NVX6_9BACT|nr:hypothetical protein [Algoriphagus yeomjeoni]RAI84189.1 hypothetical protein LV83_04082 [Algoriphagus yeomjeoni]